MNSIQFSITTLAFSAPLKWVPMCVSMFPFRLNVFLQTVHENGFSPRLRVRKRKLKYKIFCVVLSVWVHWRTEFRTLPVWIRSCRRKSVFDLKTAGQKPHCFILWEFLKVSAACGSASVQEPDSSVELKVTLTVFGGHKEKNAIKCTVGPLRS